jgi:ADP-ribose pyrophosphatase YjhB (NUDIX family)
MTKIDYIRQHPKKLVGTGAIFFNERGELLIVKPNYKEGWLVPGGGVENMESPMTGCLREIKEEVGLEVPYVTFLCLAYGINNSDEGEAYDGLYFTFYAGVLTDEQISKIVLQKEELTEFKFCPPEEALQLLSRGLSERIRAALDALHANTICYVEQKYI